MQPFSSDITLTANGETNTGRIYSDGVSIREELEATATHPKITSFLRLESGLAQEVAAPAHVVILPEKKTYIEYPYGTPSDAHFVRYLRNAEVKNEPLGKEFLDGRECEKVRVTSTYKERVYISIEWRASALRGFVVKSQDVNSKWSADYKNITLGPQPTSLFEIPSEYERIAFSQDWKPAVKELGLHFFEPRSSTIAMARKMGLRVEEVSYLSDRRDTNFIDPITGNTVFWITMEQ
jgi:hypothetical protein